MANTQTSVPIFTAGQVLTAAQQNQINTGIPVFADAAARDAAFGGTGEKTLAEGQFAFLEDTNATQFYDGALWQSVGVAPGLVLISSTTIGNAVASVTVTGAFSSTYDNYKIVLSGGSGSLNNNIEMKLGATATGYYGAFVRYNYSGSSSISTDNNAAAFTRFGYMNTDGLNGVCDLSGPNLAKNTFLSGGTAYAITDNGAGAYHAFLNNTTQYTAFTLAPPTGTMTGGTIRVYGYQNS
jgi:hypothetical protein